MNTEIFNRILYNRFNACEDILVKKAREYATEDRLHNFKQAAHLQGMTPTQALAGMMSKHTVSIYDMSVSGKDYPTELWEEKITDSINYLLLLEALVREDKGETMVTVRGIELHPHEPDDYSTDFRED